MDKGQPVEYDYAKVGELLPDGTKPEQLVIIGENGKVMDYVVEANAKDGWLVVVKRDDNGKIIVERGDVVHKRIEMKFKITKT